LPSGKGTPLQGPRIGESEILQGAAWTPSGRGYVMVQRSRFFGSGGLFGGGALRAVRSQLYELRPTGPARPFGPPLVNAVLLAVKAGRAIVASCDAHGETGILALDFGRPTRWVRLAAGSCTAAISPQSNRVAFVPKRGDQVWETRVGGRPHRVLDLPRMVELRRLGFERPQAISLAWGRGGLATLVMQTADTPVQLTALVVRRPGGHTSVVGLGTTATTEMAWQPTGHLLAFSHFSLAGTRFVGFSPQGGDLRVYDAASGTLRELAASPGDFHGLVWSPDGTALAAGWNDSELMFVDVRTGSIEKHAVQAFPLAWGPR
jgi:WD40 repeat protein